MKKRETRNLKVRELRAATGEDGKQYVEGRAACYNVLSEEFWGWRERIMPGAFTRALREKQDVRHLINHDSTLVLGRTKSGTMELNEDEKGLNFRTLLPDTSYARDLVTSISRGDIDECSFQFAAINTAWVEEKDPADSSKTLYIRELRDVDLYDVSTVTFPAYPDTNTELKSRQIPDDAPAEFRSRMQRRAVGCTCECGACKGGDCPQCSVVDCPDLNCACGEIRAAKWKNRAEMRLRVAQSL